MFYYYLSMHQCYIQFAKANIGIIDEDPSTLSGTIKIMEHLHKYVPKMR